MAHCKISVASFGGHPSGFGNDDAVIASDEIKRADIRLTNAEKNNPAVKAQPD